ncbi:MAG: hypothetical protein O7G85_03275, partial [Planctomycetota bacterium]|nr:hypothetical protein [Planctomycetota bacterium]
MYHGFKLFLVSAFACVLPCHAALAQINPGGYSCSAQFTLSQVLDTDILEKTPACYLSNSVARWYDLSLAPNLSGQAVVLRCVDFSVWSSDFEGPTTIYLRIYEDLSPEDGLPNVSDRLLLIEGSVVLPESTAGVASGAPPRPDGDVSLSLGVSGLPLHGDTAIIVEIAHLVESAFVKYGANADGNEIAPAYFLSPECSGANGTIVDYQSMQQVIQRDMSIVQQLHFDLLDCENPDPEDDCNGNGYHDACDFDEGLGFDCNDNGVLDVCDISSETSLDCDGDLIPDECETDCNTNGTPDDCDLIDGTSLDCNGNGIPDEC